MSLKAIIKFIDKSEPIERGIGKFIDRAVKRSARLMERNIKANTPVIEGHLKRSMTTRDIEFGKSEVYNQATEGGVEVNYAIHVEYGTRYMAPRAMFRKGVAQSEDGITKIFAEEAKKVHDSASGVK